MTAGGASSGGTRGLRYAGGALVLFLAFTPPLAAAPRAKPRPASATSQERLDAFAGYSFVRAGEASLNGWHLSAAYPSWRSLSLVADLSGHYGGFAGADLSQIEILVGVRRYSRWNAFRSFAEFLVGATRHKASFAAPAGVITSSGTDLTVALGLGADYRVMGAWSARAAFNLLLVRAGGWEADPRVSIGAVYRFGQR